jgi:hypothetical protein
VISIVVARHESLPSLPCNYLKIDLPLVCHGVGASHAIARAFGQELANDDKLRQAPAVDFMHHRAARSIYSLSLKQKPGLSSTDMLRILTLAIAVLIVAASAADASYCGQSSELAAAQARWVALRQSRIGPAEAEKICRAYGKNFYEAVEVRQAESLCEDSVIRKRNLDTLDAEIDAFSNLIAVQCIGS